MRKTKTQISFAVTAKLISVFVFATRIVQSLYYPNPKFQASSHLQRLYSPVCVGPGRKPPKTGFLRTRLKSDCSEIPSKDADAIAKNEDPDQTAPLNQSDLGLHYLHGLYLFKTEGK